ncbi:MAG: FkbM family methyltransferase [Gillisia sp.]
MVKINLFIARLLKSAGYKLTRMGKPINFEEFGSSAHILQNGLYFYKSLLKKHRSLEVEKYQEGLLFIINNVKHYVTSSEEIFILNEIYTNDCYMIIGKEKSYNVIDIGMNVGFSALFFSQLPTIKEVFGFEPVPQTYAQALENFSLNPDLAKNIKSFNFGIGNENRKEQFVYNHNFKGSVGTVEATFKKSNDENNEIVDVEIKDVNNITSEIISERPLEKFILKLDCEGAEFEIIESLSINHHLSKFEIIILEWHIKEPDELISWLLDANFVIHRNMRNETLGLLYAFKS